MIKALRNVVILDADAPVYDASNSGQAYWKAAYYQDGTHTNAAGHAAIAAGIYPTLLAVLQSHMK